MKGKTKMEMAKVIMTIALVLVVMMPMQLLTSGSDVTQTTILNGYIVNPDSVIIDIVDGDNDSEVSEYER